MTGLRIVRLANFVAPASGGLRTALRELGKGFRLAGHHPVLVVPGDAHSDRETEQGRVITLPGPVVPGTGVLLQPEGADRRLPAVARLLRRPGSVLVAHRPERRAVVRTSAGYAKVTRPGRGVPAVEALSSCAFAIPRLLGHDAAGGTSLWAALPGHTLYDAGTDPSWPERSVRSAWTSVGRALRTLHDTPLDDTWPVHTADHEHRTTAEWLAAATSYGLLPPVEAEAALEELIGKAREVDMDEVRKQVDEAQHSAS